MIYINDVPTIDLSPPKGGEESDSVTIEDSELPIPE